MARCEKMVLSSEKNMPAWRRLMNEKPEENNALDLSALDFGPSWARDKSEQPRKKHADQRGDKGAKPRGKRDQARPQRGQGRKPFSGDAKRGERRRGPRPQPAIAPEGVAAEIMPIEEGVDNLAKEIVASGRTHSVFELARMILVARERYKVVFRREDSTNVFYQSKHDGAVFLTQEECVSHFAKSDWKEEIYSSEQVEVEGANGKYSAVSKCGFSGFVFGPSSHHEFGKQVAAHHAAHFAAMDLEKYKSRIESDSAEEVVQAWVDSTKKLTRYTYKKDPTQVVDGELAMLEHFKTNALEEVFRFTHRADVDSQIPGKSLAPGLLTLLKDTIADQKRYPSKLAPFLCRQLSGRNLAVFKWMGKLHCGPSRPHQIADDVTLSDRLTKIKEWVSLNEGAGIDKLWEAVLPAEVTDEDKHLWYHDLHWMLDQGYLVLMHNGVLYTSSASKRKAPAESKPKGESEAS